MRGVYSRLWTGIKMKEMKNEWHYANKEISAKESRKKWK